ncbi:hypothetical protein SAMN05444581_103107 [Methylocapsa palsarum]|uniref:Uncharacterized protein n=1 Tax=Methylocapsa palsarum TaxID=1612308 RepID=A0A1I3XGJ1_9HYPH|nr:hypothetical protein SAMN05444581_103107 [Methylocapsa palsarum]
MLKLLTLERLLIDCMTSCNRKALEHGWRKIALGPRDPLFSARVQSCARRVGYPATLVGFAFTGLRRNMGT